MADARAARVTSTETDQTGPRTTSPSGTPALVIATATKGPAFVPTTTGNEPQYTTIFGTTSTDIQNGPLASVFWLDNQSSLAFIRVLGAGDGNQRVSSGNNKGKVTNAGFVVGAELPQASLDGANGPNPYANSTGINGRTYLLGAFMSQSTDYFSTTGNSGSIPVLLGMLMSPSGVLPTLSASNTNSTAPTSTTIGDQVSSLGCHTGSVRLTDSRREFVLLLNGHKGTDPSYPNCVTASFDPTAANWFGSILNKDPLKIEQAGHLLYSHWYVHPNVAVVTGSGIILPVSGAGGLGAGYEPIAFLLSGSTAYNSGSATVPNFENFEDRFRTASTPWITSQLFGGSAVDLFKIWALSDGESPNTKYKFSIENIKPSTSLIDKYGTFDLLVRDFNDTDGSKVVIEPWRGLSLNPSSNRFIGKIIGTTHTYFNFDTNVQSQKLETDFGENVYPNVSNHIRIQLSEQLESGEVDATALPFGFRGSQHLMTSGSAPVAGITDSALLLAANLHNKLVQPPVPMRLNLVRGSSVTQVDRTLYWGVQFEKLTSLTEPNASGRLDETIASFTKYYPNFQTEWMNVSVKDNTGASDTAANGVVDVSRFNNNEFSLNKVKIAYSSTTGLADPNRLSEWVYVRAGNVATNVSALTRALATTDLSDSTTRSLAKFTFFMEGGWDGVNPFNQETKYLTNNAVVEELNNSNRGLTAGPTVTAYTKALGISADRNDLDIQLINIPGIRHRYITDTGWQMIENDRYDAMLLMDVEERDTSNNLITDPTTQELSVRYTASDFSARGLDTTYAAAYLPNMIVTNRFTRSEVNVPASVVALAAFARNDAVGYSWSAPAGYARTKLSVVKGVAVSMLTTNVDTLQAVNINPIISLPGDSPVIWGQRTTTTKETVFDRIGVRRMMIALRREIRPVANRIIWEPNMQQTVDNFKAGVAPILKKYQEKGGLEGFKIDIDTSKTTEDDIANKTIKGRVIVTPTSTLEFLDINFVLTNRGSSFA